MNIEGLDYNTQRKAMLMAQYGRQVEALIASAKGLKTKKARNMAAGEIIDIMARLTPEKSRSEDFKKKLWHHLAYMSSFELDVDYPVDITEAKHMQEKPDSVPYNMEKIRFKHYGHLVESLLEKVRQMPPSKQRDDTVALLARQMKRDLGQFASGNSTWERVSADILRLTGEEIHFQESMLQKQKAQKAKPKTLLQRRKSNGRMKFRHK